MENKLKQHIQEIQDEEFANIVISPSTDKLYELVQDVAQKFAVYCRLEHALIHGYDNGQLDIVFNNFIENVYTQ